MNVTNEVFKLNQKNISKNPEKKYVKIASIQLSSVIGNTSSNIQKIIKYIHHAVFIGKAKIIILPECSITGYFSQDFKVNYRLPERPMEKRFEKSIDPTKHALSIDSKEIKEFQKICQKLKIYLTLPFIERETDDERKEREKEKKVKVGYFQNDGYRFFNTLCLCCPNGEIVKYRKLFPWMYPEKSWVTSGKAKNITTIETEYGKIGLAICYDIHNILPLYKDENLWSLVYVIAWVDDFPGVWFGNPETHKGNLINHLKENDVDYNLLSCNWSIDKETKEFEGYGYTTIYDKNQKILNQAVTRTGTEIIYANIPIE